ncbi:MAG: right-handed parallel beta-helix repeat-containing protein, partial [Planctomycetales bacterium]|nr:right-handed parallel beta-helix repeat-containing protein [Planctomycetales bacterium]
GLAEGNRIHANRSYGISIGHADTDNVMRNNEITTSGKIGILFRDDARGHDFWPNRNVVENNRIIDSGGSDGVAIDIRGKTKDVKIINNEIRESREPSNRIGIQIGENVGAVAMENNTIHGFAQSVKDLRERKS